MALASLTPTVMKTHMDNTLRKSAPSFSMIKKVGTILKLGRESVEEDPHSGQLRTATTEESIEKITKLMCMRIVRLWASHLAYRHTIS